MDRLEWSEQYALEAEKILCKIKKLKVMLKKETDDDLLEIKRRLIILESMYRDCREIANMLMFRRSG